MTEIGLQRTFILIEYRIIIRNPITTQGQKEIFFEFL